MTREEMIEQLENAILLIKQNGKDWLDERDVPVLEEAIKAMKMEPCEDRKNCPHRHENGNCLSVGGFCLAVDNKHCQLKRESCGKDINVTATDAISRQAVLDKAKYWIAMQETKTGFIEKRGYFVDVDDIKALPSVQPEQKIGHWIDTGDYFTGAYGSIDYVECSCCHEYSLEEGDYCPNCGAKMEEGE